MTVAVWALTSCMVTGPPPESACTVPVSPYTDSAPPSVLTVAGPSTCRADSGPPPVSACSAPVRPVRSSEPPSVPTVAGPLMCSRTTGAPPESTFAPATPEIDTGSPLLVTVADTLDVAGTVTTNVTLQLPPSPQAGSARVRRPPETGSWPAGGGPADL